MGPGNSALEIMLKNLKISLGMIMGQLRSIPCGMGDAESAWPGESLKRSTSFYSSLPATWQALLDSNSKLRFRIWRGKLDF